MKKSILRASAAWQALALLGAGVATSAIMASPAAAQDYTSGAIAGTVKDAAGAPVAGAKVVVTSVSQGQSQTTTTNSSGQFQVNALPVGNYNVSVNAAGKPAYRANGVSISSSQTAQLSIDLVGSSGQDIVVTGTRAVRAFSGTTTGLNVDVADFIKTRPLGRDLTSIVLLAPGTAAGDAAFGNLPSIGGSSVAENAYYLNGLNLTNFDNYLGSATVPFYFYRTVETKNGGYPAEFGRATGGIVNAVTKSGTNDWTGAVHIDWAPNFLRSPAKDTITYDGTAFVPNSRHKDDRIDTLTAAVELGGPIIRDRLFVYGLAQFQRSVQTINNNPSAGTARRFRNDDPFWGVKVDAYPIASQHLELTLFDTRNTNQRTDLPYSIINGKGTYGSANSITDFPGGGLNYVGKYTGRFTNFLTLSAAYGRVRDRFDQISVAGAGNLPAFSNRSGTTVFGVPDSGFFNAQRIGSNAAPYTTERKFIRADADILLNFVGAHHFRLGFDQEKNTLTEVTVRNGGAYEFANGGISPAAYNAQLGGAGIQYIVRAPNSIGPVIELNYFNTGGVFKAKNRSYYLQDEWRPTDRLTLNLGVRRDDFAINKPSGNPLAILKKNYAPRIGAEYTILPDRSGRFFGSYGWYYLPIASNTAFRQGAPSYFFRQRYQLNGVDPTTGLPVLGALVTNQGSYQTACPFALIPGGGTTNCNVTGDGADINTTQAISSNLKATRESEFIFGYAQKLGDWRLGLTFTHRNLDRTSEDSAIDPAVNAYCAKNNIVPHRLSNGAATTCARIFTGFHQYVINNPGSDITVNLLANGYDINNKTVTLSAADLGYGKAKRTYDALTFSFDRKNNGVFGFGGSYTYAKSKGNIEGGVQSDFGQTDTGITQDFDQPGFVDYSYGYLPNDRRHQLKLYGDVNVGPNLTLGLNAQVFSPRPLSCFGFHPTDLFADGYGAASHYCGGKPSPRGTAQKTDRFTNVNFAARYNLHFGENQVITLRADVFNVFNSKAVVKRYEFGDLDVVTDDNTGLPVSYIPDPNYGLPTQYQAPRYVRLGLDIAFGGPHAAPAPVEVIAPPPPPPPVEAPATQTCADGTLILATAMCPVAAPPPPPPPPPASSGERG